MYADITAKSILTLRYICIKAKNNYRYIKKVHIISMPVV